MVTLKTPFWGLTSNGWISSKIWELEIGTCASSETSVGVHVQFYPNFNVNLIIIFLMPMDNNKKY